AADEPSHRAHHRPLRRIPCRTAIGRRRRQHRLRRLVFRLVRAGRILLMNGSKRDMRDWVRDFANGRISRREFVERASLAGFGLLATERSEEHTSELQSLPTISYAV